MRFGISTHLYHDQQLSREHLGEIASAGFDTVELFATRSHFDYHDPAAIERLAGWLADTGLSLHSVHAPIVDSLRDGQWSGPYSNATSEASERSRAVVETEAALDIARVVPYGVLVVHIGTPAAQNPPASDNSAEAARRSLEKIDALASSAGVRMAVEVIPNTLSTPATLVRLIEDDLELQDAGVCFDVGHARIMGDPIDAIETLSGHIITTHIHDNRGAIDEHLCPYEGSIDWGGVMMSLQKVGYEGVMMFEVANTSTPAEVLAKARNARERLEEELKAGLL